MTVKDLSISRNPVLFFVFNFSLAYVSVITPSFFWARASKSSSKDCALKEPKTIGTLETMADIGLTILDNFSEKNENYDFIR